ncbi:MAG: hypothetical protein ACREOS_10235 [Candidatus Dormibacteraceae bacterium]
MAVAPTATCPYISVERVEEGIERIWKTTVQFIVETIRGVSELSRAHLNSRQEHDQTLPAN